MAKGDYNIKHSRNDNVKSSQLKRDSLYQSPIVPFVPECENVRQGFADNAKAIIPIRPRKPRKSITSRYDDDLNIVRRPESNSLLVELPDSTTLSGKRGHFETLANNAERTFKSFRESSGLSFIKGLFREFIQAKDKAKIDELQAEYDDYLRDLNLCPKCIKPVSLKSAVSYSLIENNRVTLTGESVSVADPYEWIEANTELIAELRRQSVIEHAKIKRKEYAATSLESKTKHTSSDRIEDLIYCGLVLCSSCGEKERFAYNGLGEITCLNCSNEFALGGIWERYKHTPKESFRYADIPVHFELYSDNGKLKFKLVGFDAKIQKRELTLVHPCETHRRTKCTCTKRITKHILEYLVDSKGNEIVSIPKTYRVKDAACTCRKERFAPCGNNLPNNVTMARHQKRCKSNIVPKCQTCKTDLDAIPCKVYKDSEVPKYCEKCNHDNQA